MSLLIRPTPLQPSDPIYPPDLIHPLHTPQTPHQPHLIPKENLKDVTFYVSSFIAKVSSFIAKGNSIKIRSSD